MNVWNSYGLIPGGESLEGGHYLTFDKEVRRAYIKSLQEKYKETLKQYRKYKQDYPYTLSKAKKIAIKIIKHIDSLPSLKTEKAKYRKCVKALVKAGMSKGDAEYCVSSYYGQKMWQDAGDDIVLPPQNDDIVYPSTPQRKKKIVRPVEVDSDLEDFELPTAPKAAAVPVVHQLHVTRRGPKTKIPRLSTVSTRRQLPKLTAADFPTLSPEDQALLKRGRKQSYAEIQDLVQRHFINPMNASRPTLSELQRYVKD